ncbi:MAG: hypothetical protein V4808_04945 [Pseudomonadota bacterium]
MLATVRALTVMLLAPPAVLLLWAHLIGFHRDWALLAIILAGTAGLAGAVTAPWSDRVKTLIAAIYVIAAIPLVPLLSLVAVCTTGDCS